MNVEIDSIRRRLLVKYPFFGSIVANTNFIENSSVGTAGTDGENIYYNPLFINELDEKAQTFIFAHEVCHIAFDHIFRSEGKDPELWNIATDSVINAFLEKDGFKIVGAGVNIPDAINYDAEQMYEKLLEQKQKEQKQGKSKSGQNSQNQNDSSKKQEQTKQDENQAKDENSSQQEQSNGEQSNSNDEQKHEEDSKNRDVGHDTHSMWNKAIEKKKQQEQGKNNQNQNRQEKDSSDEETKDQSKLNSEPQQSKQHNDEKKESIFDKLFNRGKKDKKNKKQEDENQNNQQSDQNDSQNNQSERNKEQLDNPQYPKREKTEGDKQKEQTKQDENQAKDENSSQQEQSNGEQSNSNDEQKHEEDSKNRDVGHDTHSMWNKAIEKKKQQEQGKNNQNQNRQEKDSSDEETKDQSKLNSEPQQSKQHNDEKKESIFDKLFNRGKKDKKNKKQEDENQNNQQSDQNDSQNNQSERNKEQLDNPQYPKREKTEGEKQKEQTIKRLTEMGEKSSFKQNKVERKKQLEELRQALASESHGAGVGTNREQRKIDNIGIASPLFDWRRLLKETVKYDVDWSYKNASIEDGVVTPYLEEIPRPETEILLDTSGSVSETLLRNFLRECKNILQTSKVKVGCFDDEFYGFTEIKNENDIDNMNFQGGGGTNFNVAISAFTRRVENKIVFTDGEARMPHQTMDAIWIVFGGRKINPPGGKVIYINEESLNKLFSYYIDDDTKIKKI